MVAKHRLARGDVWWVDFGVPSGPRPAVVLTRASLAGRIDGHLVIPCTRTVRNVVTEVVLGKDDGMPQACVANAASATIARQVQFTRRICRLPAAKVDDLCAALAWFTGCN